MPYLQVAGAYDIRLVTNKEYFTPWSTGLLFNHDRAGDAKLSLSHLGLTSSYAHRLNPAKRNFLSFGAAIGVMQRAFQPDALRFDDQYSIKEGFQEVNLTQEVFDRTNRIMGDVSGGINLHLQADSARSGLDIGAAIFHFNEPKKNFSDEKIERLQSRNSLYLLGRLQVSKPVDLMLSTSFQFQGPNREAVLGLGGVYHLSNRRLRETALQLGFYYRPGDAISPAAGFYYRDWQVQLSFDLNTSPLREATLHRGGPELSVIYILKHVPNIRHCKSCPTYM